MKCLPLRRLTSVCGYNIWVVVFIFGLSLILGILNNQRVYEEQRVPLWGVIRAEESLEEELDAEEEDETADAETDRKDDNP